VNRYHRWYCRSDRWATIVENRLLPWVLGTGTLLGDDVLEVGPGPGVTTERLRARVSRLTALELDPALTEALRRRIREPNVDVVQGDATAMPFPEGRFTAAVSFTMLHHIPSPDQQDRLLREVHRVLRPGGLFAGSDSTPSLRFRLAHLGDTMTPVNPATFPARLAAAGFRDVQVNAVPGSFRFRARRAG
jgi:SAM-dependent methyltransferase